VAIVRDGSVVQTGDPRTVWSRPADLPTARLLGHRNLIRVDDRSILLRADGLQLIRGATREGPDRSRDAAVALARGASVEVTIASATFDGGIASIRVVAGDGTELHLAAPLRERWREGDTATLHVEPEARIELG
jgi:ABC-type Fe3+/spermidine/putrescine transport system ATPase subunit